MSSYYLLDVYIYIECACIAVLQLYICTAVLPVIYVRSGAVRARQDQCEALCLPVGRVHSDSERSRHRRLSPRPLTGHRPRARRHHRRPPTGRSLH